MTYVISFPRCELCGTRDDVWYCQVCNKFYCSLHTTRSDDFEHCEHISPAQSEDWRKYVKHWNENE